MSGAQPPLTYDDVIRGLKALGFHFKNQKGSHEHWERLDSRRYFKVTVDKPKAPFSPILIGYMAQQAGVSKREFYRACRK